MRSWLDERLNLCLQLDEKDLEDSLLDDASSEEEVIDAKRPTSNNKGEQDAPIDHPPKMTVW